MAMPRSPAANSYRTRMTSWTKSSGKQKKRFCGASYPIQMSVRNRTLVLTPDARRDIRGILNHSLREWGASQRKTYKSQLDQGMKQLLQFPHRGPARDDISPGLRGLVIGAHIVCYRIDD